MINILGLILVTYPVQPEFPKGTRLATKEEIIRLLRTANIDAEFNQQFNEKTNELVKDTSVILIGRPMNV